MIINILFYHYEKNTLYCFQFKMPTAFIMPRPHDKAIAKPHDIMRTLRLRQLRARFAIQWHRYLARRICPISRRERDADLTMYLSFCGSYVRVSPNIIKMPGYRYDIHAS